MNRNWKRWKRTVRIAIGVLLAVDLLLVVVVWRAGAAPESLRLDRDQLAAEHKVLSADVLTAAAVRSRLAEIDRECGQFFQKQFLDVANGYSTVVADFNRISRQAGLAMSGVRFREQELEARRIAEVEAEAVIEGDYTSLVRFINGLERSPNFYLLKNLALASSTGGRIRLNLGLKTYFRR